jgi:hypothetical protein
MFGFYVNISIESIAVFIEFYLHYVLTVVDRLVAYIADNVVLVTDE